MGISDMYT